RPTITAAGRPRRNGRTRPAYRPTDSAELDVLARRNPPRVPPAPNPPPLAPPRPASRRRTCRGSLPTSLSRNDPPPRVGSHRLPRPERPEPSSRSARLVLPPRSDRLAFPTIAFWDSSPSLALPVK